jgi:transglutaminase-like putative cysteine protease
MKFFKFLAATSIIFASLFVGTSIYADEAVPTDCPPPPVDTVTPSHGLTLYSTTPTVTVSSDVYLPNEDKYPVDESGHTQQVTTSYNPDNTYTFTVKDGVLTYYGIDKNSSVLSYWPHLTSTSNVLGQTIVAKSSNFSLVASYDISAIADGSYDVSLYTSNGQTKTYSGYIYRQVTLVKDGDDIYFQLSPEVYQINKDFTDKNYRSPEYYLYQAYPYDSKIWVYTNDTVKGWAEEITANCTTDYEKIKAVHDWVADNIYYDYDYYYSRTTSTPLSAEDVYNNKYSVCQGYADLSASLLRSLGIPCKVTSGYGKTGTSAWTSSIINGTSSNHAWNEAWLADEQRWVIFDATWDSTNKRNETSDSGSVKGDPKNIYFDITPYMFANSHKVVYCAQQTFPNLGNVNLSGSVDNADVAAFLKHFSGTESLSQTALQNKYADVDGNQRVDFLDVIATLKKIAFDKNV